jgi:hypoxanthine phosphoribosyltransferase
MKKRSTLSRKKRARAAHDKKVATNNLRVVLSEKQIQKRLLELAREINRDYQGKPLHVIGILGNCFMFLADLVRALDIPVTLHTISPEIHDTKIGGTAMREITYTPKIEATGKDVLLVDGVLQSGLTLDHVYRYVLGQNPKSVRTATLIEKTEERKVDVATDYVGFKSTSKFLVGYGMGHEGKYRNLPFVAQFTGAGL